jgi:hypothetical protein
MPPLTGSACSEWTERYPVKVLISPRSLTPKRDADLLFHTGGQVHQLGGTVEHHID